MLYPISEPAPNSVRNVCGYINGRGEVTIGPSYLACSHFFEGKASVIDDTRKSGFINHEERVVLPHRFEGLGRFHQGLCNINGGYIDSSGNWVIKEKFLVASNFSEGRAFASTDGEAFGFIDYAGSFVIHPSFQRCLTFSEGLAAVCRDDCWGYIDRSGEFVIPGVLGGSRATGFRDGLAGVQIDGLWGFIDPQGRFVVKPQFENAGPFVEGRACVQRKGKWGFVDADGQEVVRCQFDVLRRLDAGMAPAQIDGKAGFRTIQMAHSWTGITK
jgi:WG containing repeat